MIPRHYKFFFIIFGAIAAGLFAMPISSRAAELFTYPKEYEIQPGQVLTVDIRLDAKLNQINVVKAKLTYPKDLLSVKEVSTQGSFLRLFPEGPTVDAQAGTISLTGGIPHGAYVVGGKVVTITFNPLTQGTANIAFDQGLSAVLLNDGKGTPAALTVTGGTYHIIEEIQGAIAITSPTHPDENTWYKAKNVTLLWNAREGAQYSFVLSLNPFEKPDDIADTFSGSTTYTDVADGARYFIVKERKGSEPWRIVGRRRVLIDTLPPSAIQFAIGQDPSAYEGKFFLAFASSDATSGIARFDVIEGSNKTADAKSPYILLDQSKKTPLKIIAYDAAGNSTEAVVITDSKNNTNFLAIPALISCSVIIVLGAMLLIWRSIRRKKKKNEQQPEA